MVAAAASTALAQALEPESIRIDYAGPTDCPGADAFVERVRARTTRWRSAPEGTEARAFIVRVRTDDAFAHGELTIVERDARRRVRDLDARVCSDLVDALALMTALAIDPSASLGPVSPPPASSVPPAPTTAFPRPISAEALRSPPGAVAAPRRWSLSLGAGGDAATGVTPAPLVGGHVFVEARLERFLRPSLRAYGTRMETGVVDVGGGGARFGLTTGGLELCPLRLPAAAALGARPCVGFGAGQIEGAGIDVHNAQRAASLWLDTSLGILLEWAVVPAFSLGARVAAAAPLLRPTFEFEPSVYVYRVPPVVGSAAVEVGLHFL
jgi:hypothetical protein